MDVFLFPLVNVTLFPKTTKPLNIFEPRYIEMVKNAVQNNQPIALGFIEDPTAVSVVHPGENVPYIREIAGYGGVQIIEERPNGTMLVFIHGIGKCRVGKVKSNNTPYLICEAEPLLEDNVLDDSIMPQVQGLNRVLARWITTHIPDPMQREIFMRNLIGPEEIVGAFATYLVRDYDMQQMVLEFNSIVEKVKFLHRLVESNEVTA